MLACRLFISAMVLAAASIPAFATLTTYTTQAAFDAANSDQTFTVIAFPAGSRGTSYTDLISGVVFSSSNGLTGISSPSGWPAGTAIEITPNSNNTQVMTLTFPTSVISFAMYWGPQNFSFPQLQVSNTGGDSYSNSSSRQSTTTTPMFFGLRTTSPISSFTVTTFASVDHLALDDVQVGTTTPAPTPEVATFFMIGGGLIMLGFGRRWMPHARKAQPAAARFARCL